MDESHEYVIETYVKHYDNNIKVYQFYVDDYLEYETTDESFYNDLFSGDDELVKRTIDIILQHNI